MEFIDETVVRAYLKRLGTGEDDAELETLVPDGDYELTEVDVWDTDAWAADETKASRYADTAGAYPPVVIVDGHLTDGNHRILAARARGDSYIAAYVC